MKKCSALLNTCLRLLMPLALIASNLCSKQIIRWSKLLQDRKQRVESQPHQAAHDASRCPFNKTRPTFDTLESWLGDLIEYMDAYEKNAAGTDDVQKVPYLRILFFIAIFSSLFQIVAYNFAITIVKIVNYRFR